MSLAVKTDAPEWEALIFRQNDSNSASSRKGIGHQAFAACFVDRWTIAVRDHHTHALRSRRNGGGKTGWSSANDKNIGIEHRTCGHVKQLRV